ncbi:MAG: peptidylprolyl isomerase [Alphaproteobacteria bacterium]|nr:peptidylprolyl isomerase [Alphaproteobacteria bacterium]
MLRRLLLAALLSAAGTPALALDWSSLDAENVLVMQLRTGPVIIEMRPDVAPNHVARIKQLVRAGFYDGLAFHRVIPGFMAQTGDPRGDGSGGSGQNLKAEFSNLHHMRGTVSMARTDDEDNADSQFFIMLNANLSLDHKYTIWGRVIEGMENVDQIKQGTEAADGRVDFPDRIVWMKVAADMPAAERDKLFPPPAPPLAATP